MQEKEQEEEKTPELEHVVAEQAPPKIPRNWWQILQLLGAYLVAAWTLLQFLDWILSRNQISPHWVDLFLWLFIGILPSFFFYLLHKERLDQRQLVPRDKVLFSGNLLLLIIVLFFGFRSTDLGATTAEIRYTAADGTVDTRTIIKQEFRIGIKLFNFEKDGADTSMQWLIRGIPILLAYDMTQDKAANVGLDNSDLSMASKIGRTELLDFFVDGTYALKDGVYTVTPKIHTARNGKLLSQRPFSGGDLLAVLDSVSIYIRREAGIFDALMEASTDLPLEEFTSSSLTAIQYFCEGTYAGKERAVELDSTFALASFELGKGLCFFDISELDTKFYLDRAYRHRSKLPLDLQYAVLGYRQIINHDIKAAEATLKLQLEIDPESNFLNNDLAHVYQIGLQFDELLDFTEAWFDRDLVGGAGPYGNALVLNLQPDEILKRARPLLAIYPKSEPLLLYIFKAHLIDHNWEAALDMLQKIKLMRPEWETPLALVERSVHYQQQHKLNAERYQAFLGQLRFFDKSRMGAILPHPKDGQRVIGRFTNAAMLFYPLGDDELINIGDSWDRIDKMDLIRDSSGQAYAINGKTVRGAEGSFFLWKIDSLILKAESLLLARDFEKAAPAYREAIATNPNHYFLKDGLAYIEYAKTKSATELQEQFQSVAGNYGDRHFWVENGRLFYKRRSFKDQYFPKMELFPISETRYCNLERQQLNFAFEYQHGEAIANYSYLYDLEKTAWSKNNFPTDYVVKDDSVAR